MPNTISVTRAQLQDIYVQLQPFARAQLGDGNCSDEQLARIKALNIDLFFTDIDLIKSPETPRFLLNKIWYGDAAFLKSVYALAVKLDQEDGVFDGTIAKGPEPAALIEIPVTEMAQKTIDWKPLAILYLPSIFPFHRIARNANGDGNGTAWVIERLSLPHGGYRYWIITNAHVVDQRWSDVDKYKVDITTPRGVREAEAELLGADHINDVAVLTFEWPELLPTLPTAQTPKVEVGDRILIIGNQLGQGIVQTEGTVNAVDKYIAGYQIPLIQDDSSALKGNSGSPVFDGSGKVIGICSAGSESGENYNIYIDNVLKSFRQIKARGVVEHGGLAIWTADLDQEDLDALGVSGYTAGLVVQRVVQGSTAEKSGLRTDDIIVTYDGKEISGGNDTRRVRNYFAQRPIGSFVTLEIFRDKALLKILCAVESLIRPAEQKYWTEYDFFVRETTPQLKQEMGYRPDQFGVAVDECDKVGEQPQCRLKGLLTRVNGKIVRTINQYKELTNDPSHARLVFRIFHPDGFVETFSRTNRRYKPKKVIEHRVL